MRVVIPTHHNDRHGYFAHQIIEQTGTVVGVITGAKRSTLKKKNLPERWRKRELQYAARNRLLNAMFWPYWKALKNEKDREEQPSARGVTSEYDSVNHASRSQSPHRVVPCYRGGYTNLWPIIEGDYGYIGFLYSRDRLNLGTHAARATEGLELPAAER